MKHEEIGGLNWRFYTAIGLLLTIAGYFYFRLGVKILDLLLFLLELRVLIFSPGYIIVKKIGRVKNRPGVYLTFSLLVGYLVSTFAFFLFSWLQISFFFYLLFGAIGLYHTYIMYLHGKHNPFKTTVYKISQGISNSVLLFLALFLIVMFTFSPVAVWQVRDTGFYYMAFGEKMSHLAMLGEMLRSFPPKYFPEASGLPFPSYQIFPHLLPLMIYKFSGIPLETTFFVLFPALGYALFLLAAIFFLKRAANSNVFAYLGTILLFLTYIPGTSHYVWEYFHYVNLPSFYGALVYLIVLTSLCFYQETGQEFYLKLSLFAAALLFQFKAQYALLLYPAFAFCLFWFFRQKKKFKISTLLYFIIPFITICLFTFFALAPTGGGIKIIYAQYVNKIIFADLKSYPLINNILLLLPDIPRIVMAALLSLLKKSGGYGLFGALLLSGYGYKLFTRPKKVKLLEMFFLVQYVCFFLSFLFVGDTATEFNQVNKALLLPIFMLSVLFIGVFIKELHNKQHVINYSASQKKRIMQVLLAGFSLFVILYGYPQLRKLMLDLNNVDESKRFCSKESYDALLFLRNNTAKDAIIFNNVREIQNKNAIGGVAQRRALLDGITFRQYYTKEKEERRKDIAEINKTTESAVVKAFFRKYSIEYFLEEKEQPLKISQPDFMKKVYENRKVIVWEVLFDYNQK